MNRLRPSWYFFALTCLTLTIFCFPASAQTLNVLHAFVGTDGSLPIAGLIRDQAGNFYGTTEVGGNAQRGTVYQLDATNTLHVLHSFTGSPDGSDPVATLLRDSAGNLYGTTTSGGAFTCDSPTGCGIVFKLDANGNETILHSFKGGTDGAQPWSTLIRDAAGNLYGTTEFGGDPTCNPTGQLPGCGTIFKISPTGVETVLHAFAGAPDGAYPIAGLVSDGKGTLFGTTKQGGNSVCLCGTVFAVKPSGNLRVLYRFRTGTDAAFPEAALAIDPSGNLYGTTYEGGTLSVGTVFKLDTAGNETVLHSFGNTSGDGYFPTSGVVLDAQGNLYGSTSQGGNINVGILYEVSATGTETVLYSFGDGQDGAHPNGLIRDSKGNLYGTTQSAGDFNYDAGTIFQFLP